MEDIYNECLPLLEDMDATLEEKKDSIDRVWNFMNYLIDKAWDDPEGFEKLAKKLEESE